MQYCGLTLTHLRLNSCRFVDNAIVNCISMYCTYLKGIAVMYFEQSK